MMTSSRRARDAGRIVIHYIETPVELDYVTQGWTPPGITAVGMKVTAGTGLPFRNEVYVSRQGLGLAAIRFSDR